ncbi:MAG: hypothetical protein Fur0022_18160 [Anaerolineales bacterium]
MWPITALLPVILCPIMCLDIQRGAPTEIDAICGAVVRVGEEVGVATPVNRVMWGLVRAGIINPGE